MNKNSVIWSIEDTQTNKVSYLLGTMHVKDDRAFGFQEKMFELIQKSDAFAAEFNLDDANQHVMGDALNLSDGATLEGLFKAKDFARIKKVFEKNTGMPIDTFNDSKPFLASNILTESILSNNRQQALDMSLWHFAKANQKIMLGVETYEEQIAIMHKIPLEYQVKALKSSAKNFKNFRKQILKAARDYEAANIRQLYKSAKKSLGTMRKILLYDRNLLMAERIAGIAKEQSACFAIGAAHFSGKKGLIRLLKQADFKVKPVY